MVRPGQKGMIPIIYILAAVVLVAIFGIIIFQFSFKQNKPAPQPPSNSASLQIPAQNQNCADRDYTGCDGVDVVRWTDDGKR